MTNKTKKKRIYRGLEYRLVTSNLHSCIEVEYKTVRSTWFGLGKPVEKWNKVPYVSGSLSAFNIAESYYNTESAVSHFESYADEHLLPEIREEIYDYDN